MPEKADIPRLAAGIASGKVSAEDLVRQSLERIARHNGRLRAVIRVDSTALEMARELDRERERTGVRSPLHGIPILVKDNIETAGAMPTTAGSLALAHNVTGRDAHVVAQLRNAGAVILGKTNLSEWANFRSTTSSSGWSAVGGQTVNAHDGLRSPCGSSSGSGVAVAAGWVAAALGTETDGSIVCPSSVNGIVGIKPTVGLVSRAGIVPISMTQDTAGPMATTVAGAALLLSAMTAYDDDDPAMAAARDHLGVAYSVDFAATVRTSPLAGIRVGVVRGSRRFHPAIEPIFVAALDTLRKCGATVIPELRFDAPEGFRAATLEVLLYEFKQGIEAYLRTLVQPAPADLAALIAFNLEHAKEEMPYFGQELFEQAARKSGLDDAAYRTALALIRRATREDGIDKLMVGEHLDAIVGITSGPAWSIDSVHGDRGVGSNSTYPAVAGYPHVTVPMGELRGLPMGLSVYGRAYAEATLIRIAHAYEQARQLA